MGTNDKVMTVADNGSVIDAPYVEEKYRCDGTVT